MKFSVCVLTSRSSILGANNYFALRNHCICCIYRQLTPLHLASKYGHLDIVRELLSHGADVGERDKNDENALDIAIAHHNV